MTTAEQTLEHKCLKFTLELTKTSSAPISRQKLFSAFMEKEELGYCKTYFNNKITEMLSVLATMSGVTVEEKARWIFVTSTPFTESRNKYELKFNEGLRNLKKDIEDSGVAVFNGRNQIVKYSDKEGNVKFEGVHSLLTGTNKNLKMYKNGAKKVSEAQKHTGKKVRKLIETSSDESDEEEVVQKTTRKSKKFSKTPLKAAPKSRRLIETSSDESDGEEVVQRASSTRRPRISKFLKTHVKKAQKAAPRSRRLIETSSDESDVEEEAQKAPRKLKESSKTSVKKERTAAPKRRRLIETSSDESDGEEEKVQKTPPAPKKSRKRSFNTSKLQEVAATSSEAAEYETQQENVDPSGAQPLLQESLEVPAPKRMFAEKDEDVVLRRIANMKTEIDDDDIVFEGIVVPEKKPSRILIYRPSILGGMDKKYEELIEEEEEPRNIHTLGFLNCLKEFLIKVFGISNEKAMEMQKEISRLIQKGKYDPNFMAMDVSRLHRVLDDNLGRLAVQATNKAEDDGQLDFLMVLCLLKDSCHRKLTPELGTGVIEMIEEQIDCSEDKQEMISWDSILEVMRRVMQDIRY